MKRSWMKVFLAVSLAASSGTWAAQCSSTDKQNMKTGGMADERIAALCGDAQGQPTTPTKSTPTSNVCQTSEARCTLPVRAKLGESCWCTSPMGAQQGLIGR